MGAGPMRNRGCSMSTKKNTRPDVGASERARLEAETWQATASSYKHTTLAPTDSSSRVHISNLLSRRAENNVTLCQLVAVRQVEVGR